MATQYTPILKLALPVTGELSGTWGDVVNDNITSMVEQAVAGLATINSWTANAHTLTTANGTTSESRCAMLVADDDGAGNPSAAAEIICPAVTKLYVLKNISGQQVTLKTSSGTGVAVANNQTAFLFCDGTNVNACVTTIVDGRITGNLTVDGNTTLGNATSDTITATARFASGLIPSADNTQDLGSSGNSWKDLYIDGTAYLALVDINGGTIDGATIGGGTPAAGTFTTVAATTGNITTVNATTVDTTNIEVTNIKAKDGTASATIADSTGVMTIASSVLTTTDINGGTIDGTIIGGASPAAGTFTTATATTGNITTVNATTVDTTDIEVTNIKAKDGTASATIADSTGIMTIASSVLTTTDINGGTIDGTTIGGVSAAAGTFTTVAATTGNITTVNATTVDTTNIEVTNIKAKDGTAAATIADSTGAVTVSTLLNVDNLRLDANTLSSTNTNGNIVLAPNGTGDVQLDADTVRIGDSNANATLTTNGTGDLILNTNAGTNSGSITIADAANGDISLAPNGNGSTVITNAGTSDALRITQTGTGNALVVEDSANPDATPFVVDASGRVLIGTTTSDSTLYVANPQVQVSAVTTVGSAITATCWGATTAVAQIAFGKSKSGVIGTRGIVASGDTVGVLAFSADDGNSFIRTAQISSLVDGTPGTNDMPGRLAFATTADGSATPTERVRINSSGLTTVGFSAATGVALSTTVAAKLYSSNTTYTDGVTAASGTVTHGTIASFDNPAIAATNATVTYTNASTVYIDGAPTAGSNVTITNPYALYVAAGTVYFGGTVSAADPIVQQTDTGTAPNEIPLNQYLGALAYVDTETPALAVGTGITAGTGTICKVNGGLSGGIYRVTILVDLTGLNSGGTAGDIIGVNGTANPCYIALLPDMVVLGGRMTCLETPAGGDTDIDLYSATEGTGVEDQAITALTETQIINAGTQSAGTVTYFAADPVANTYLYLVGQSTSNATYTAGRFLIEIFGVQ
jgi:hypothetical protein